MHSTPRTIRIHVSLRLKDHSVYVSAQRNLARIMGGSAPDVETLIGAQLTERDVVGVTDEYLDRIGWSRTSGRAISLREAAPRPRKKAGFVASKQRGRSGPRASGAEIEEPVDPSRN